MTSPLREMAEATEAMARGDFSQRVTATSRDEIGTLARSFNQMAAELAETDRLRRDLVANVSHELRTPITALQAVLENLVDGVEPPDPETLRTMLAQVERLGRLVQQLLDLSRLEAGVVPLDRQPFDVEPMLDQAVRESRLHARRASTMTVQVDPADLELEADHERLHQVVAEPGRERGAALAAGRHGRGHARAGAPIACAIEVTDEGPGHPRRRGRARVRTLLPRRHRPLVARRRRRSRPRDRQWIVDLHGGEIHAERREPHGCRMVVTLPAGSTPAIRPAARTAAAAHSATRGTSMALTPIDDALRRIRRGEMVLVVDDEDRENEGDLTMAAEWVTPESINFMLRWARGLVCMPCHGDRLDAARDRPDGAGGCRHDATPPFAVTIDHRAAGSGIGAADRALTIRRVLDPASRPGDFLRPGHVFPLRARHGGVLERRGPHRGRGRSRPCSPAARPSRSSAKSCTTTVRPHACPTSSCSRRSTASR